jgi:heme-degrading monooxygenase HmoA
MGLVLTGCTIGTPYREAAMTAESAEGSEAVVVSLTHITLSEDREARRTFWREVRALADSMEENPGFRGISLRRQLFGKEAWTLTVWENEESLREFVRSPAHRQAMNEGAAAAANMRFARFTMPRKELPLPWDEALALLEAHLRKDYSQPDNEE